VTLLAHKIALNPNAAQRIYFARASGVARFSFNWALGEWRKQYALKREYGCGPSPSDVSLRRQFNALKRESYPWVFDVSKCAVQEAIIDLGTAFRAFFEGRGRYPRFKRKNGRAGFCAANEAGTFRADGRKIKLPVIGWVRMREEVRFSGPLKRATVSLEGGRWFVSLMIDTNDVQPVAQPEAVVGVDLGVTTLATLSTGEAVTGPKAHKSLLGRLRRLNKSLARKRRGSHNFRKAKAKLGRLHARIGNIRKDATHKLTTRLTKTYRKIGIEDLNVRGMAANRSLARSIMDGGFFELRRQLTYKAKLYGSEIVVADRFEPSSKTCSCCGVIKDTLALAERTFRCDDCEFEADRDVNAALNLKRIAASSAAPACGENRADTKRKPRVKRSSAKQEENTALSEAA
jgi:putative transposase